MPEEDITRIRKQVEQIKNEKEAVIKTLQAQRARFHKIQEEEEDALNAEALSPTIANLEVANKIINFIKWNTNLSLIEHEIVTNYKMYTDELLQYIEEVADNEEQLIEAQQELEATSMERDKLMTRIQELEIEIKQLGATKNKLETKMVVEEEGPSLTEERKQELNDLYYSLETQTDLLNTLNPRKKVLNTNMEREYLRDLNQKVQKFKGKTNIELYWERRRNTQKIEQKNLDADQNRHPNSRIAKNVKRPIMGPKQVRNDESANNFNAELHENDADSSNEEGAD